MRKSRSSSRRLVGVSLLLVGVLSGITVGGPVSAAPSTTATWKVSSLQADQVMKLSSVVSTNSPGVKTWSKKGSCTLMPRKKPTKLKMGVEGSCVLKLQIARSKSYSAKRTQRTITLAPSTTLAPVTTTGDTLSCATGGTCAVGEIGPGGGTVFYVASSQFTSTGSACDTACTYLEAAPVGWIKSPSYSGQIDWCSFAIRSVDPGCMWSRNAGRGTYLTRTAIGTGYANTSAMITQSNTRGRASKAARAFQGGGKTDWFLPSKDELNALCKWAFDDTVNALCNREEDDTSAVLEMRNGGFAPGYYWSSSESILSSKRGLPVYFAWYQSFKYGFQGNLTKSYPFFVRPVRAF